ncbi:uncharacterized protein LOC127855988 isoform X2 [Dreissena polymorpha]|nr:uncharacterized protein LOC127855988 isoform X2 [Dreissena polymorpha]XP_052247885.1 uncharacterized protein LOC127855988 isoform X2 [Dreissena polymorpha]XP_052247886.1 uncharacterized protein LOC127855988 isoform X2 [Dreissena polymorpha]
MPGHSSFTLLLICCLSLWVPAQTLLRLETNVTLIRNGNTTSAAFVCRAGKGQLYYLNHVITWSKIGRDGHERYLSINWDLVQHGVNMGYSVRSMFEEQKDFATVSKNLIEEPVVFMLGKSELVPADHGEYVCRVHDLDRKWLAESSVPVIMFENGLAITPYKVRAEVGKDVGINCQHDASKSPGGDVVISHVTEAGQKTTLTKGGKFLATKFATKYSFSFYRDNTTGIENSVLTIKDSQKTDDGYIVCELKKNNLTLAATNATVSVDGVKLKVEPLFYLEVPQDAEAEFQCACDVSHIASCLANEFRWSLSNSNTSEVMPIYKSGKVVADSKRYEVMPGDNGASLNLTIHGMQVGDTDYICSLHNKTTGKQLARASLPSNVIPVTLRSMALIETGATSDRVRLLCALSGIMWDKRYFDNHRLVWSRHAHGVNKRVASNGRVDPLFDQARYSIVFDVNNNYSVIEIASVTEADYGDYICELININNNQSLLKKTLHMFGRGNTTTFGT